MSLHFKHIYKKKHLKLSKIKSSFSWFCTYIPFLKCKKEKKPRKLNIVIGSILAIIGVFLVYQIYAQTSAFLRDFDIKDLIFAFGTELKQDENGYTNFLLLGKGGENHDGPELTDTIIVASLDNATKTISMLSIPRDYYLRTEYYGSSRINEIVRNVKNKLIYQKKYTEKEAQTEALNVLIQKVQEIVELDLQYYALIDFNGFKKIVNTLDGIDVVVQQDINDQTYPAETGWGYEPFKIKKGAQHLDGKTALKYARSRHTTSDFDRARRQQEVIQAIKDKALAKHTLTNPTKIKRLFNSIQENFETNMSLAELISLSKIASEIKRTQVISKVLVDDPSLEGGFLATPPRADYGGAFVLIPYTGDMEEIHRYTRLIFKNRAIYLENAKIEIQNGTGLRGIAGKIATKLGRYGFNITSIANTPNRKKYAKSQIILKNIPHTLNTNLILPIFVNAELINRTDTGTTLLNNEDKLEPKEINPEIIIILGSDYKEITRKL